MRKGPDGQHFPLDAIMLDSRPMTGQGFLLILMMDGKIYNIWFSSCSGLLHMELYRYAPNFLFLSEAWKSIRTGNAWEVHTKSPSLRSDEYGRSMDVLFWPHGRKIS